MRRAHEDYNAKREKSAKQQKEWRDPPPVRHDLIQWKRDGPIQDAITFGEQSQSIN